MKKWIFIVLIFLNYSCSDDDTIYPMVIYESGPQDYGWVKGKKNCLPFSASGMALLHDDRPTEYFGLRFNTYSENEFTREEIIFNKIKFSKNTSFISGPYDNTYNDLVGSGYFMILADGDVLGDVYQIEECQNNYIEITSFDTISNLIKGVMDISFAIDTSLTGKIDLRNPDHVRFSEVEFEVSIRY